MKRRVFGLTAASSVAIAAVMRPAVARAAADPSLLTTSLTPAGAERAGNADGSIPAWTGGLVGQPTSPTEPTRVKVFADEQPLYTVDANNIAQYEALLSEFTKTQITKFGCSLKVYPTHRTAAWPQYVIDNMAKNVTRAQLDPRGGRFGFVNAYGGAPFPIPDATDKQVAGAQIIWNHLTCWNGYSNRNTFSPGCVVINGEVILVSGARSASIYPYYDPNGSVETFDGYLSKGHYWAIAPSSVDGQETLVWHSTNVNVRPDIVWTLLNGQGRVRKAPDEAYDDPNPDSNGISNLDESTGFFGNPSQYDWTLVGKQELLIPYNINAMLYTTVQALLKPNFIDPDVLRWEKHRVWVVEATLHPGIHNVNAKRRYYFDEDTWSIVLGEGYDAQGNMVKGYANYLGCIPSYPATSLINTATYNLQTGDYVFNGCVSWAPDYPSLQYTVDQPESLFEPQQMSANASF